MTKPTISVLRERWDLTIENVALKHQLDVLECYEYEYRPIFANDRCVICEKNYI